MSKTTKASKGQPCIRCGINDGTICGRHYNGAKQLVLGKGRSIKMNDLFIADLCIKCDAIFSEGVLTDDFESKLERDFYFAILVLQTIERRFDQGVYI